jgi:hypothetical protein
MSRLLAEISKDPALLQWLHNRSRRVFISDESLKASACTIKTSAALPQEKNLWHPSQKNSPDLLPGPLFAQNLVETTLGGPEAERVVGSDSDEPVSAPPLVEDDKGPSSSSSASYHSSSAFNLSGSGKTSDETLFDEDLLDAIGGPAAPAPVVVGITSGLPDALAQSEATMREVSSADSTPTVTTSTGTAGSCNCSSAEQRKERAAPWTVDPVQGAVPVESVVGWTGTGLYDHNPDDLDTVPPSSRAILRNGSSHGSFRQAGDDVSPPPTNLVSDLETEQSRESDPEQNPPSERKNYVSLLDDSEVPCDLTETLYIPVFRTDRFILGEMHSNFSANAKVLFIATQRQTRFVTIARRFVANLFIENSIEFVEYEWFEGGFLVVVVHKFAFDGSYTARYVVFAHLNNRSVSNIPSIVLMTLNYNETPDCPTCLEHNLQCICEDPIRWHHVPTKKTSVWSWSQWITGLYRVQSESATGYVNLAVSTPQGDLRQSFALRISRKGVTQDVKITKGRLLSYEYAALLSADNLFPTMDCQLADVTDRRRVLSSSDGSFSAEIIDPSLTRTDGMTSELTTAGQGLCSSGLSSRDEVSAMGGGDWHSDLRSGRQGGHRDHSSSLLGSDVRRKSVITKRYFCACGHLFTHRGHYNAHLRAVHMK